MALKTLRVCLSSELPGLLDRDPNYMYFTYDKLFLYEGQNLLSVNYAIASALPENIDDQVEGMFYLLNTDGSVHRKVDYVDIVIATIEESSQIELLKKAGTMFYINADHRYIDSQTRALTLPWNDGSYELNVSTRKDMVYDENTILKFNPETNRFEVYGDTTEEFIDFSKPFHGKETDTAKINVDGPRISGDIKISKMANNIIGVASDGLYIVATNYMKRKDFDSFAAEFVSFYNGTKAQLDYILSVLDEIQDYLTPEYINQEILTELQQRYPTIDEALANYDQFVQDMADIEDYVVTYMTNKTTEVVNDLMNQFNENSSWNDLDDAAETYVPEIDYYRAAQAITPTYGNDIDPILINAAITAYLAAEEEET